MAIPSQVATGTGGSAPIGSRTRPDRYDLAGSRKRVDRIMPHSPMREINEIEARFDTVHMARVRGTG
jgi:hypothetical protein